MIGQAPLSLWLPRSRTKITRSHGPITLWMWMFSTVLHFLVLPEIETLQEKKNWYMKLSQPLPPMPAILGDFTCAVYQVTFMAPKYHFLDARWSLGSKLVFWTFFGVLYRVRNARSAFYAWVRVLYWPAHKSRGSIKSLVILLFNMRGNLFFCLLFSHKQSTKSQKTGCSCRLVFLPIIFIVFKTNET